MRDAKSLDAQIASMALRISDERIALERDRVQVQVHLRKLPFTPPVVAIGLTVLLLIAWNRFRRH